jgi:hypothetical protein
LVAALGLVLAMAGPRSASGQFAGTASVGHFGPGFGTSTYGVVGLNPSLGYGIRTGQIGAGYGYGTGYGFYQPNYYVPPARTTIALQPLYSAITSLPGWDGPTGHVPRRVVHRRPVEPPIPTLDRDGNILWPSTIHDDPSSTALRKEAEAAVHAVVRESQSTRHASIRPVIDAKAKLSAYERKILPGIKGKNITDGDNLERFFVDLNRSLDAMNAVF